jgi:hypothetical protein
MINRDAKKVLTFETKKLEVLLAMVKEQAGGGQPSRRA